MDNENIALQDRPNKPHKKPLWETPTIEKIQYSAQEAHYLVQETHCSDLIELDQDAF